MANASQDGRETGGILLGHQADDHGIIRVQRAEGPGPEAIREPARFQRDLAHANRVARRAWASENLNWIGDWHTHPMGGPRPSRVDLDSAYRLLCDDELRFTTFVSIIVTPGSGGSWRKPCIDIWLLSRERPPTLTRRGHMAVRWQAGPAPRTTGFS